MSPATQASPRPTSAAFFDLDRTLISGSSVFAMALAARSMKLLPTNELIRDAVSAATFKLRGDDGGQIGEDARKRILGFVKGQRQDDMIALNGEVLPVLLEKIRPEARRLVDSHRHADRDTYIVSAAPQEIVEPLAIALGMTAGIGTKGAVDDGIYTGELDGPFCYGDGKVEELNKLVAEHGYDLSQCYAYSDSVSDLPMLHAVGHPVAVNPDAVLAQHAHDHTWPIVLFNRHTKAVMKRSVVTAGIATSAVLGFLAGLKVHSIR